MSFVPRCKIHDKGPEFSRFVLGCWRIMQGEETYAPAKLATFIRNCMDIGITTFDLADVYGVYAVETLFGDALRSGRVKRESIEIVTKCGICREAPSRPETRIKHYNSTGDYIISAVDLALKSLGTYYIDLLLLHRPDPLMNPDDTARGLLEVVKAGKVRHVGVSNYSASQLSLLQSRLSIPLITNQVEFSLLKTDPLTDGTLDQATGRRTSPMIWSPLAGGALLSGESDQAKRVRQSLKKLASIRGCDDMSPVALAWLMMHPSKPIPVIGSTRFERIKQAAKAFDVALDRQDWFELLQASHGAPVP